MDDVKKATIQLLRIYVKEDGEYKSVFKEGGDLPSNKITLKPIMVNNYRWYLDTLKMEIYEDEEGTKSKTSVSKMTSQEREQVYDQMFHDKPMITFDNGGGVKKDNTETILWAVKIGEPDWNEVMITNKSERIEGAKKWAAENGFDRLRVSTIDLNEKPDFTKTIKRDGGGVGEHTITFDKDSLNEYKGLYNEAVENKHSSFVHKGNLQDVNRAKRLIDRFEKEFSNSISGNKATIPYKEIYSDGGGISFKYNYKNNNYTKVENLTHQEITDLLKEVYESDEYQYNDKSFIEMVQLFAEDDFFKLHYVAKEYLEVENFINENSYFTKTIKRDGGDVKTYPYENKDILVLIIDYAKNGVKQQALIQFNNGKLFTNTIYVDYGGRIEIPNNVETMEDAVDFIYEYSYYPKNFVKINSVKYPRYISENTTHLIEDLEAINKMKQYLESKNIKRDGGDMKKSGNYSKEDILNMSYVEIFDVENENFKNTLSDKQAILDKPNSIVLPNNKIMDTSDVNELKLNSFDYFSNKFPNKKVFLFTKLFVDDLLDVLGYHKHFDLSAGYFETIVEGNERDRVQARYWIFKDAVIYKLGF
jgi:hypothetical protein